MATANKGDVIELGLQTTAVGKVDDPSSPSLSTSTQSQSGPLICTFDITHKGPRSASQSLPDLTVPDNNTRILPNFQSSTLKRLLNVLRAEIRSLDRLQPSPSIGRYQLIIEVQRGGTIASPPITSEEEVVRQPFPKLKLAPEPTLKELLEFADQLKGRKVVFYANSKSSFAQYLTGYLTAWGMDVSPVPTDTGRTSLLTSESASVSSDLVTGPDDNAKDESKRDTVVTTTPPFLIIDDDVDVLRARLTEFRSFFVEETSGRPSLAANHRPKSSRLVHQVGPYLQTSPPSSLSSVIVYFTSLSNYRIVKDTVQSALSLSSPYLPEVFVIPKPAGPRRFLTALHTAVTKPFVDPLFFSPIATSPMSFGGQTFFPVQVGTLNTPRTETPLNSSEILLDKPASISLEGASPSQLLPASPLPSDNVEYFSKEANKFAGSASSGLFVQSPDGRPGIYFQPPPLQGGSAASVVKPEFSEVTATEKQFIPPLSTTIVPPKKPVTISVESPTTLVDNSVPGKNGRPPAEPLAKVANQSAPNRSPAINIDQSTDINPVFSQTQPDPKIVSNVRSIVGAKAKTSNEIVPPICVLIVEGEVAPR